MSISCESVNTVVGAVISRLKFWNFYEADNIRPYGFEAFFSRFFVGDGKAFSKV